MDKAANRFFISQKFQDEEEDDLEFTSGEASADPSGSDNSFGEPNKTSTQKTKETENKTVEISQTDDDIERYK